MNVQRSSSGSAQRCLPAGLIVAALAAGCTAETQTSAGPAVESRQPLVTAVGNVRSQADCEKLLSLSLKDTEITSVEIVPESGMVPEYCSVQGGVETLILFEIALPTAAWNGRFYYVGGGGYNGNIPDLTPALARGYAATATDTGHRGEHWDASALYEDPQAQLNYAHRGAHLVTVIAKQVVAAYYDAAEFPSYFMGCSNGGKMGLMAVQRHPEDFDGVVVGGPVIDRTGLMVMFDWSQRALLDAEIPPYKIPAMEKATLAQCDAIDGLADGVIGRPDRCDFDPGVLLCAAEDNAQCLTPPQVDAWRKILDGPKNSAGESLYVGYLPGHEDDYPDYVTGSGVMHGYPSSNFMYMDNFMRWFVFGHDYDPVHEFDFDTDPAALDRFVADQDAVDADLSEFRARGGKLIIYNGWADHSTPPQRAIQYYEEVQRKHGAETGEFARLFMVPGFHHCSGGPGPNVFGSTGRPLVNLNHPERDLMGAIVDWVEHGVAPDRLIATKFAGDDPSRGVERTRPLCHYPQVSQYAGSGSIDDEANFVCASPTN